MKLLSSATKVCVLLPGLATRSTKDLTPAASVAASDKAQDSEKGSEAADKQHEDKAPEKDKPPALQALLPAYTDRLFMASQHGEHKKRAEKLAKLQARHEGPGCAAQVPAHVLDERRVKVVYPPDELFEYT